MALDRDADALDDVDEVVESDDADATDETDVDDAPVDEEHDGEHDGEYDEEYDDVPGEDDGSDDDSDDDSDEGLAVDDEAADLPARPGFLARVRWTPLLLFQAAHAKQAIITALAVALVALLVQRPAEEVAVVLLTVLVGQTILGWHNDIVDKARDEAHGATGKPIADGRLDPGAAWYAIIVAALVLVPLSITTGITAGAIYLVSVCVGMLGNVILRTGFFSWVTWAVSYAMLPAYVSYGGWGGQAVGDPPETAITILAGLLGIGVHFMRAVWGLVADHEDGWTYLPLKLGLKLGATRLLALSTLYTVGIAVALAYVGYDQGLSQ